MGQRALDLALVGQRDRAVAELFKLIRSNPDHPMAMEWISSARGMLGAKGEAAPVPSPAASGGADALPESNPPVPSSSSPEKAEPGVKYTPFGIKEG